MMPVEGRQQSKTDAVTGSELWFFFGFYFRSYIALGAKTCIKQTEPFFSARRLQRSKGLVYYLSTIVCSYYYTLVGQSSFREQLIGPQ